MAHVFGNQVEQIASQSASKGYDGSRRHTTDITHAGLSDMSSDHRAAEMQSLTDVFSPDELEAILSFLPGTAPERKMVQSVNTLQGQPRLPLRGNSLTGPLNGPPQSDTTSGFGGPSPHLSDVPLFSPERGVGDGFFSDKGLESREEPWNDLPFPQPPEVRNFPPQMHSSHGGTNGTAASESWLDSGLPGGFSGFSPPGISTRLRAATDFCIPAQFPSPSHRFDILASDGDFQIADAPPRISRPDLFASRIAAATLTSGEANWPREVFRDSETIPAWHASARLSLQPSGLVREEKYPQETPQTDQGGRSENHRFEAPQTDQGGRSENHRFEAPQTDQEELSENHRFERQLRFLGKTIDAADPCETIAWPTPEWTTVRRPKHLPEAIFRVEWDIGGVSNIPTRFGSGDGMVSPQYNTATDLHSIWISAMVTNPQPVEIIVGTSETNGTRQGQSGTTPLSVSPTLDFDFSVKFTTSSRSTVRFGIFVGDAYIGPLNHSFCRSPWSSPQSFGNMKDLLKNEAGDAIEIAIEIYDVPLLDNVPRSMGLMAMPGPMRAIDFRKWRAGRQRSVSVTVAPSTPRTSVDANMDDSIIKVYGSQPLRTPSSGTTHSGTPHSEDSPSPSPFDRSQPGSPGSSAPIELMADIILAAATQRYLHEAQKMLHLGVCLCQAFPTVQGGKSAVGFPRSTLFEGIRTCIMRHFQGPHWVQIGRKLRALLLDPVATGDAVALLTPSQIRWIHEALPSGRGRAETLL